MVTKLEGLPYVDRVDRIQSPHKLMDIRSSLSSHQVKLGGVTLGQELFICAGPCTIDPKNPNLTIETRTRSRKRRACNAGRSVEAADESLQLPG
jgi:3-deoxy-7-phosphoheptulonate synthase